MLSMPILLPLKIYKDLSNPKELRAELNKVSGVYGVFNNINKKQYIGSSLDMYERLTDHLKGNSSNIRLQRSIIKYGIENYSFIIYYYQNRKILQFYLQT
jgi:group I intron endonuclease